MRDEIEKIMIDCGGSAKYRIVNFGGSALYVEGIKSVVNFSESEMNFQLNMSLLEVKGDNLKIKYLDKTTCTIMGKICSVVVK